MASGRVPYTRELYEILLSAFREAPGNYAHALRASGMSDRKAMRRVWEKGWRNLPWARPIKVVLEEEQKEALLEVARQRELEREERDRQREAVRQEAIKSRVEEGQAADIARRNSIAAMAAAAPLLRGAVRLAARLQVELEKPDSKVGQDPERAAKLILDIARANKFASESAHRAVVMSRLITGRPTDILGIPDAASDVDEMSMEECLEELQRSVDDAQRAMRSAVAPRELKVIEGGKQAADGTPAPAPSGGAGSGGSSSGSPPPPPVP